MTMAGFPARVSGTCLLHDDDTTKVMIVWPTSWPMMPLEFSSSPMESHSAFSVISWRGHLLGSTLRWHKTPAVYDFAILTRRPLSFSWRA